MRLLGIGLLSVLLIGCETTTTTAPSIPVVSTKFYKAPYDTVWASIIRTFGRFNIPIQNMDKSSGAIYAKAISANDEWHTCKWGIMNFGALALVTAMDMNVIVHKSKESVIVDINLSIIRTETRSGGAKYTSYCPSSGVLENMLWASIESNLNL